MLQVLKKLEKLKKYLSKHKKLILNARAFFLHLKQMNTKTNW